METAVGMYLQAKSRRNIVEKDNSKKDVIRDKKKIEGM